MRFHNIVTLFLLILMAALQSTLVDAVAVVGIKPNILLVIVITAALLRGSKIGMINGLLTGFIQDAISGKILGVYMLLGFLTGLLTGVTNRRLYRENIFVAVGFSFIITLLYESVVFLIDIFTFGSSNFIYAFRSIILPEACYNAVIALILFLPTIKYIEWIEESKKLKRNY